MMTFQNCLINAKAGRAYADKPVGRNLIDNCIEPQGVPSASNSQPWLHRCRRTAKNRQKTQTAAGYCHPDQQVRDNPRVHRNRRGDARLSENSAARFKDQEFASIA
jgi:hypothetical protein